MAWWAWLVVMWAIVWPLLFLWAIVRGALDAFGPEATWQRRMARAGRRHAKNRRAEEALLRRLRTMHPLQRRAVLERLREASEHMERESP